MSTHKSPTTTSKYFTPSELLQLSPVTAFRHLLTATHNNGNQWLIKQLHILHAEPEMAYLFATLDSPRGFDNMYQQLLIQTPRDPIAYQLRHLNAESHAVLSHLEILQTRQEFQAELQTVRQEAANNLSLYQKLKRNIRRTIGDTTE
jgi:hypothetical protein